MSEQQKINILLVDDQPSKLLSYEVILHDLHENLLKASSGREALPLEGGRESGSAGIDAGVARGFDVFAEDFDDCFGLTLFVGLTPF